MDTTYFYDESDSQMFPAKPAQSGKPKGMISISLNFIFYLLVYFFVFGGDLKLLTAVLLVMFIHEFGHFIWMKRFGYNDKRMFFIPFMNMFLGADDRQVTLKQKMLILFFGPAPGIILGLAALYFGQKQGNENLVNIAWIFLTWNLVNLFPLDSLDGGQLSENLFYKENFIIQLVVSIFVGIVIVLFVVVSRQLLLLIVPLYLGLRLHAMTKMSALRKKLEDKGIDWKLNYEELNNKQYWLIRKELLSLSSLPNLGGMADEFTESIYEGMIMQNIKSVLLNRPYDDFEKNGRLKITILWALLFIVPLLTVIFLNRKFF